MFLEKLKENKSYSKIILLIAALMLVMALLPMHAHAASAVKTRKIKMRVGQSIQLQLKDVTENLNWKSLNKKKLRRQYRPYHCEEEGNGYGSCQI